MSQGLGREPWNDFPTAKETSEFRSSDLLGAGSLGVGLRGFGASSVVGGLGFGAAEARV